MKNLGDFVTLEPKNHKYYTKDGTELESVSSFIKRFCPPFDPDGSILNGSAVKKGVEPEELRKQWDKIRDDACVRGIEFHEEIEYYIKNREIRDSKYKDLIKNFALQYKISDRVYSEVIIGNLELGLAGTIDVLDVRKNYVLVQDLKSNKSISKYSFGRKMLSPLDNHWDSNYNRYVFQISAYCYLLDSLGYWIGNDLNIFWVNFAKNRVEKIPVEYRRKDVELMLNVRNKL